MRLLSEGGMRPDYLLFARLTTSSSHKDGGLLGRDVKYRRYQLQLRMVDATTLETVASENDTVDKAYRG